MNFHAKTETLSILESAYAQIHSGLINKIITDDPHLLSAKDDEFDCKPSELRFISLNEAKVNDIKSLLRTAVFLRNFGNIDEAHNIFRKAGVELFPHLHLNADIRKMDIVEVISKISAVSAYYELTAQNVGVRHTDRHSEFDVSVIVPVYGVENYVEKCAASLKDQNFKGRYEVLFIDDGGKDRSVEIINNVINDHPHLKILSKPNGGAASARNFGIRQAKGQYIAFVDGDDYVSPDYVDSLFRAVLLNNADISQAEFCYVNASTGEISPHLEWYSTQQGQFSPVSSPAFKMMQQTPGIWRRLYSRKLLDKYGTIFNEEFRRHDDLPFNIEVLSNADNIAITRTPVYYYLLGRDGQDVGATDERLFIHFRLFEYTKERITRYYWNPEYFYDFIITMCAHHLWAYDRIDDKFKSTYLQGLAEQVFRSDGPIGIFGRTRILSRHFKNRRRLILKAALISLFGSKPLPSDV